MNAKAKEAREKLEAFKSELDPLIDEHFDQFLSERKDFSPLVIDSIEKIRIQTARGGKRLRASLMYYAYILLRGKETEKVMRASVLIEILQAYILWMDDIMDKADLRRGGPTTHKMYEEDHRKKYSRGDPEHFGISLGMNLGLITPHMVEMEFAKLQFPEKVVLRFIGKVNEHLMYTGFGQLHDVVSEVDDDITEEDADRILRWKSAAYTYELPIHAGAILAGATDDDLDLLSEYAIPAGCGFQVQDDILGMFGDEKKFGKSVGSDITEGKRTILILEAYKNGTPDQKKKLDSILGKPDLTEERLKKVQAIVRDTGAYDYSKKKAEDYVSQSLKALEKMGKWGTEGLAFLEGISQYMIEREL